jgi:Fur family peroxide stress response transcriptional regulator
MTESGKRLAELIGKLKQRGYRLTPQRMAVLKILAHSDGHPSVDKIYEQVRDSFPMTSLGTVYKTITLLKDMGEVLELGFSDDSNRYDGNKPYPHPHLICIKCKNIIDPDINTLESLPSVVAEKYGYQILGHRLDFYGICPECQAKAG